MPQQIYTVEIDGKQYDIEGDRPPTEAEARSAIGAFKPETTPEDPAMTIDPSRRTSSLQPRSVQGYQVNPDDPAHDAPFVQRAATVGKLVAPFMIPGGALRTAGSLAAKAAPIAGQAVIGGAVGGLQGGAKGALSGAILGAAGGSTLSQLLKKLGGIGRGVSSGASALAPKAIQGSKLFAPGEMVPNSQEMAVVAKALGLPPNQVQNLIQQPHRDFLLRALDRIPIQDASGRAAGAALASGLGTR